MAEDKKFNISDYEEYVRMAKALDENYHQSHADMMKAVLGEDKKAFAELAAMRKKLRDDEEKSLKEMSDAYGKSAALMTAAYAKSATSIGSQFNKLGASVKMDGTKIRTSMDNAFKGGKNGFGALKAGSKEFSNQLGKGLGSAVSSIGMLVKGGEKLFEIFKKMDTSAANIAKSMNMTYQDAWKVRTALRDAAYSSGEISATGESLSKSMVDMNTQLGTAARFNNERLIQYTKLRDVAKFEPEVLEDVNRMSAANNQTLMQTTKNRLAQINLSKVIYQKQIDERKVMQDIAKASYNMKLNYMGRDKDLAKAATQARALGMELSQSERIAEGLMDFEGSITKQMEAEVLTGQTLNLEKARYYAMTNDIAGLQSELNAQGITAEKYGKMNRIQQSAIAEAMGMSKEEMSKMLVEEKALKNIGAGSLADAKKEYDLAVKNGTVDQFTAKLGDESLARQFQQQSLQERMNMALEKMLSVFEKLAVIFKPFYTGLVKMAEFLGESEALLKSILFLVTAIAAKKLLNIGAGMFGKGGAPGAGSVGGLGAAGAASSGVTPIVPPAGAGVPFKAPAVNPTSIAGSSIVGQTAKSGASVIMPPSSLPSPTVTSNGISTIMPQTAGSAAPAATGSIFSKIASGAKGVGNSILGGVKSVGSTLANPKALLTKAFSGLSWGKFLKMGGISSLFELFFANQDIKSLISSGVPKEELNQLVGKRAIEGVTSIIAGGGLGALLSPIPGGTIIGGMLGAAGGKMLGGFLADYFGASSMGAGILDTFYKKDMEEAKVPGMATGGVVQTTGIAQVDAGEFYAGMNSADTIKAIYENSKQKSVSLDQSGTVNALKELVAETREQNKHLVALVNKNTVLKLDGQVLAQSATRTAATQYGNLLNGNSYV